MLAAWHMADIFSAEEKLALQWAEELTLLNEQQMDTRELLANYFSERQIVDLTAGVALMNGLNRIAIALRD